MRPPPLNSSTLAVTSRYAMLVADANVTGALHLVNTGKGGVRVTLRARAANGSSLGAEAGVCWPPASSTREAWTISSTWRALPR